MALPQRFALCLPPIGHPNRAEGHVLPSEESASLWLWAWPRLLGWRHSINWLFSPVTGKDKYPGDLWGIDSRGNLVLVETKIDRDRPKLDPFEDFVPFCKFPRAELWTAASLEARWLRLLKKEMVFLESELSQMTPQTELDATYPGVVPYSRHRDAVWRWQHLYRTRIAPAIADGRYERAVRRGLRCRRAVGNPKPVFIGLVASIRVGSPELSSSGQRSMRILQSTVGSERVLLRGIRGSQGPKMLRIQCWGPL